jgi:hypothetical protein
MKVHTLSILGLTALLFAGHGELLAAQFNRPQYTQTQRTQYTPPPERPQYTPRPEPRPESTPRPERAPEPRQPEFRPRQPMNPPEPESRPSQVVTHPDNNTENHFESKYKSTNTQPQNQPDTRPNTGVSTHDSPSPFSENSQVTDRQVATSSTIVHNSYIPTGAHLESHSNQSTVVRPAQVTPAIHRAMRYNQVRANGSYRWRLSNGFIADRFGNSHLFHIHGTDWVTFGSPFNYGLSFAPEAYFQLPGSALYPPAWFGVLGPFPSNWMLGADDLYIVVGDDGNYYLCDATYPGVEIQVAAVQNVGDDQSVDPADPDDQEN